jgi:hypothetical protein
VADHGTIAFLPLGLDARHRFGDVVVATAVHTGLVAIRGKAPLAAAGPTRLLPHRLARVSVLTEGRDGGAANDCAGN